MSIKKCKLNDYPEQLRPRERMALLGADKLTDVELLAILISTGNKETNVLELASHILQAHKGITGLQNLTNRLFKYFPRMYLRIGQCTNRNSFNTNHSIIGTQKNHTKMFTV